MAKKHRIVKGERVASNVNNKATAETHKRRRRRADVQRDQAGRLRYGQEAAIRKRKGYYVPPGGTPIPRTFMDRYKGKVGIVLGNGPSLNDYDLTDPFFTQNVTIGSNAIGKVFLPTFYFFADKVLSKVFPQYINRANGHSTFLVFGPIRRKWPHLKNMHPVYYNFRDRIGPPNYDKIYHCRTTGAIMVQIMFMMGFQHVFLLGIDGYTVDAPSGHFYDDRREGRGRADSGSDQLVNNFLHQAYDAYRAKGRFIFNLSKRSVYTGIPLWKG